MGEYLNSALICGSEWNRLDVPSIVQKLRLLSEQTLGKVLVIGKGQCNAEILKSLIKSGAHKIIYGVSEQSFLTVCEELIVENKIGLITFLDSCEGKELASILATKLGGGLTADCIDIEYQRDSKFIFSRAAVNDSVIAKVMCIHTDYQMCTIKKNAFVVQSDRTYHDGIANQYVNADEEQGVRTTIEYKIMERTMYQKKIYNPIDTADLVFGFGRGICSAEILNRLKVLAERCSAEIGGTRASVEAGLIEEANQIGQSGISISPKVYVAFGISGASQHIVGLKNAKTIISINHNKQAPIIDFSDYVLIGDVSEVIEELLQILQEDIRKES